MKIYVASSWRNTYQPHAVNRLRALGHEVYDFRGPGDGWGGELTCLKCEEHRLGPTLNPPCETHKGPGGFAWHEVDPEWQSWPQDIQRYLHGLDHPRAAEGFARDMDALIAAEVCILVNPCGQSAHMEMGYAVGAGKQTIAWCPEIREPDLMIKMVGKMFQDWEALESHLQLLGELLKFATTLAG